VVSGAKLQHVVIVGDFNVYPDFPHPVALLLAGGGGGAENRCKTMLPQLQSLDLTFKDVWEAAHGDMPGFTFSNMVC
jgi:hypothetical protein